VAILILLSELKWFT